MCGGRARAARLCARVFAHVVGARMADAVSARWMRHAAGWEVAAWTPALPRAAEQAADEWCIVRACINCMNLIFSR